MLINLIEIETNKPYKKYILLCIIIVIILLILISSIIYCVKIYSDKEKYILEKKSDEQNHLVFAIPEKSNKSIIEEVKAIFKTDEKRVFLTFDDGPSRTVTPLILDSLKEQNIKATFFVLGSRVELNKDIAKREYEEGHYIANHGYSHIYSNIYSSPEAVLDEYNKAEQAIKNAIEKQDYNSYLFRFPGGSTGNKYKDVKISAQELLNNNQIAYLDWNALTGDSEGKKTKEEMLEYVKQTIAEKTSVVILMHDAGDKILTYEILPELVNYLREKEYSFKNIYDLL